MKTIHVAEMAAEGGRDGAVEVPDGNFRVELSTGEQPGSVTPEHLFAGAYAASYLDSLMNAAKRAHVELHGVTLRARAHLDEDDRGGRNLNVQLLAALPGVATGDAEHIMNLAHEDCPYSKATRGNINVTMAFE